MVVCAASPRLSGMAASFRRDSPRDMVGVVTRRASAALPRRAPIDYRAPGRLTKSGNLDERFITTGGASTASRRRFVAGCNLMPPLASSMRWVLAELWRTSGRVRGDRLLLYGGRSGLRILTFHETRGDDMKRFERIVEWCRSRFAMATPADADEIAAGRWPHASDRILVTFDDGWESNFVAARWLASLGVSAIFFVVPSLIGRDAREYVRFHAQNQVIPGVPEGSSGARGLSLAQLREMR